MELCVSGDADALEEIYLRYSPSLYAFLLRRTRDPDRAADLLQTTFYKVHRARLTYAPGKPLSPWLFAIARRAWCDECRALCARREVLSEDGWMPDRSGSGPDVDADLSMNLRRALDALPDAYRSAILLTKGWGWSTDETAVQLGTTRGAVKVRIHRAVRMMRDLLAADA